MHAHGIKVLDRADDDDVVFQVAHHLKFVFLPPENRFFDQRFVHGREIEAASKHVEQFFAVIGHAAAGAAEGERRAHDDWKANLSGKLETVFEIVDQRGFWNIQADLLHRVFKEKSIFSFLYGFDVRADQLDIEFFKDPGIGKLDGEV